MRALLSFIFLLIMPAVSFGDEVTDYFSGLGDSIKELGVYQVDFRIEVDNSPLKGYYVVSDCDFFFSFQEEEVFSNGSTRYVVDKKRREVTILSSDDVTLGFLSNPAIDFKSVLTLFNYRLSGKDIILTYKDSSRSDESISVCRDGSSFWPGSLVYSSSAGSITIFIDSVKKFNQAFPSYDDEKFEGYVVSDLRKNKD